MLAVENITKKFSGVTALDNVSLELHPGKVNAIIGENGAGKSTLMKILSGVYADFEGRILYKGQPVSFANPKAAQDCGIAIIHQELNLIPYLSITENIFLGREIVNRWGMMDKQKMQQQTQVLLSRLKLAVSPSTMIAQLKVGQQQLVEIAKALLINAEVIIMDEPTSAISESEVDTLFGIIAELRSEHKTIVYISHKLNELFRMADRFIVIRDGRMIEAGEMEGMTHDIIISKMVGREITSIRKQDSNKIFGPLLTVKNICLPHAEKMRGDVLTDISFSVGRGEIVGIFGLMGAGRTELMETIFGLHARTATGEVMVEGKAIHAKSPAAAIKVGLALVPEDRKKDGLVLGMDVQSNISLTTLKDMEQFWLLNNGKEQQLSTKYIADLKIKTSSPKQAAKNLSGGNQQKIVLAKWLATHPKLLMLDEPTRGIDIHAKNEIYKLILQLADAGLGILVVSSELPEILAISDRVLVMAEGRMTAEFTAAEATEDTILKAAIPKTI
ncbi:MAG: sugar ABC transporter ATP-binding protein [Chitinophagaceae bacterium]